MGLRAIELQAGLKKLDLDVGVAHLEEHRGGVDFRPLRAQDFLDPARCRSSLIPLGPVPDWTSRLTPAARTPCAPTILTCAIHERPFRRVPMKRKR